MGNNLLDRLRGGSVSSSGNSLLEKLRNESNPKPVTTSLRSVNDTDYGGSTPMPYPQPQKVEYPAITNEDVQNRLKAEMDKHNQKLRETEGLYMQTARLRPAEALKIMEAKRQIQNNPPTVDSVRKQLLGEQGKVRIMNDPNDEDGWLQYVANTMSPVDLERYQVNPMYQKAVKASHLPQMMEEKRINEAIEATRQEINNKFPKLHDGLAKDAVVSLWGWVKGMEGTLDTLASMNAPFLSEQAAQPYKDPMYSLGESLAGGGKFKDVYLKNTQKGNEFSDKLNKAGEELMGKGGEAFQKQGLLREAQVGSASPIRGFLYDTVQVVPDMLSTVALAVITGGEGVGAQLGAKEIAKSLMKKETRTAAVKAIGQKLLLSPETVPLGTKIFAQSYQSNLADGMPEDKAFFTAIINAYGQSVLEGGGINKAFREGGIKKAVDFLKSSLGEGWEEIPQNWWEGAVNKLIGGKDIPVFSTDPNQESIVNPGRDLYSAAIGATAGAAGGAVAVPEMAAKYVQEKTRPNVTMANLRDAVQQDSQNRSDYQKAMDEYNANMETYKKEKADYDAYTATVNQKEPVGNETVADYKDMTFTKGELKNAAVKLQDKLAEFEKARLAEVSNNSQTMEDWEKYQNQIDKVTPETVVQSVLDGTAAPEIMEQVKGLAYGDRVKSEPQKQPAQNPMDKLKDVKFEAPVEPKMPELPKMADLNPTVDTTKMAPAVLERMQSDLAEAEKAGMDKQIVDLVKEGKTRSEISKELNVAPRTIRSVMALKGIPDVKSAAFAQWQATQLYGEVRDAHQTQTEMAAPTKEASVANAQEQINKVPILANAKVKAAENLSVGEAHAQRLGKQLGVDVVFFEGGKEMPRGMYSSKESRTLFINREDATEGKVVMDIMGHEFLHHVSSNYKDLYQTLRDVIGDTMTAEKVQKQLEKYKHDPEYQERLSKDKELLVEEMLAEEAGSLFTDKEFWKNVSAKDETVAQKLIKAIRDFIDRILTGEKKDSGNLDVMTELQIKDFQKKFEDAVAEIMKTENPVQVDKQSESAAPVYSVRTWTKKQREFTEIELADKLGISKKTVDEWLNSLDNVAAMILNDPDRLDYEASDLYTALKTNSDPHYDLSLDFSTLCTKRLVLQGTIESLQSQLKRGLSPEEFLRVRKELQDKGVVVSCGICYVDSRRIEMGKVANKFIEEYPNLDPELFLTQIGLDTLKREHPDIYKKFNSTTGVRGIKAQESRTEYRGEIFQKFAKNPKKVAVYNQRSGLRWQSWSDFEIPHLLDAMQAIVDMSRVGVQGHAYTKVPEFVEVLGSTGLMINQSLIPKGRTGLENGELVFDPVEGMPFEVAKRYRERFDDTVGTIAVGINDDHIRALLRSNDIDYVIPYHISGLSAVNRATQGKDFEYWEDYTKVQEEIVHDWEKNKAVGGKYDEKPKNRNPRTPEMAEWWDNKKTPQQNQQKYLELCEAWGLTPKFNDFKNEENYWKLLIDRRMVNKYNENIIQAPPKPIFDDVAIKDILDEYTGGHENLPIDNETVEKLKKEFSEEKRSVRMTPEFKKWFGDSKVVNEDGSPKVVYHGTTKGFTEFRAQSAPGWGRGIYFSDNPTAVEEFADAEGGRIIPVYLKIENPFTGGIPSLKEIEGTRAYKTALQDARNKYLDDELGLDGQELFNEDGEFASEVIRELGYDGIIAKDSNGIDGLEIVVFEPTQIKSAIGNTRTFDSNNPDIRYATRPTPTGTPSVKVVMDEQKESSDVPGFLKNLYRRIINRQQPLSDVNERVGMLAATTSLVSGTVEHIFTKKLVDTDGKAYYDSWQAVTKDFMNNEDFWNYMLQLHNIDRAREEKPVDPNMTSEQSQAWVDNMDQQHPEYRAWAESVTKWIDKFMEEWAVKTGLIDPDTYKEWRQTYPHYIPTFREFSELEDGGGQFGPGKRFVDLPNPVKRATGSDRDVTNPVGNVMQMVNRIVRTARYNNVGSALLDAVISDPAKAQKYAEEIPANIGMFQRNHLDNVVTIWKDGHPHYLQINDKVLLDSLMGLPKLINNAVLMRKITGVYKGLITQYNPLFAIRNIFRDIPTAYVYGSQHNPLFFLGNLAKAGYQVLKGTGGAAQYEALGGMGSSLFHSDTAAGYAKKLDANDPLVKKIVKAPLHAIKAFNEITEMAPRVSEFNHVLRKTGDVQKALHAAQSVTVDFARGGDIAKMAEPFIPYLNASLQGVDVFARKMITDARKDPAKVLGRWAKAGIMVTVPQIASLILCTWDPENKKKYDELDQRTKDSYFLFPKGDGTFFKIPKSRELGVLFASLFERAYEGNMKGFANTIKTNFAPVNPFENNYFSPLFYNIPVNKDFAGRAIVPEYMLDDKRPKALQFDDNTSEVAKVIGKATNLSPKQLDYIIRSYTGVIGQFIIPATTERQGVHGAMNKVLSQSWTADPDYSSQSMTDFYNRRDELHSAATKKNLTEAIPAKVVTPEERMYNMMNKMSQGVSKANKLINTLDASDPKIKEIRNVLNTYLGKAAKAKVPADIGTASSEMNAALYKLGVK